MRPSAEDPADEKVVSGTHEGSAGRMELRNAERPHQEEGHREKKRNLLQDGADEGHGAPLLGDPIPVLSAGSATV